MSAYLFDFISEDDNADWTIIRADDFVSALNLFKQRYEFKSIVHVYERVW